MYFCLYKLTIDAIIVNRILPDAVQDPYFQGWKSDQQFYIRQASEYFSPIPIFPVQLFKEEVLGYGRLLELAEQIYGTQNPLQHFFSGEPYRLFKQDGGYELQLTLPFVAKAEVTLNKLADELIIRLGSFKRHVLLPRQVACLSSIQAKLEDRYLSIFFKGANHEQTQEGT